VKITRFALVLTSYLTSFVLPPLLLEICSPLLWLQIFNLWPKKKARTPLHRKAMFWVPLSIPPSVETKD
jgi:hypothetical protein